MFKWVSLSYTCPSRLGLSAMFSCFSRLFYAMISSGIIILYVPWILLQGDNCECWSADGAKRSKVLADLREVNLNES